MDVGSEGDVENRDKTREQLIDELADMRQRVADPQGKPWRLGTTGNELRCAAETPCALVERSLQGLLILQDIRIVFANPAFAAMSGYTVDELLALSPTESQQMDC